MEVSYRKLVEAAASGERVTDRKIREAAVLTGRTLLDFRADVQALKTRREAVTSLDAAKAMQEAIREAEAAQRATQAALVAARVKAAAIVAEVMAPAVEAERRLADLRKRQQDQRQAALRLLRSTCDPGIGREIGELCQQKGQLQSQAAALADNGTETRNLEEQLAEVEAAGDKSRAAFIRGRLTTLSERAELAAELRGQIPAIDQRVAELDARKLSADAIEWSRGSLGETPTAWDTSDTGVEMEAIGV